MALSLPGEWIRSLPVTVTVATMSTTLVFLAIVALFQFGLFPLIWWPVLIGMIGGTIFWLLQRFQPLHGWTFWIPPIVFFPFGRFVLLPIGIAFFPYTTHLLAEGAIGQEAVYAVIQRINVGDSFEDLHRRYPQIFTEPIIGMSSYSSDGTSYSISFDDKRERVTKVELKKK